MNTDAIKVLMGMFLFILCSSNSLVLFQVTYVFEFIALAGYTFSKNTERKIK
jgi:hypothetical protein